eukprot:TRINITY_DN10669_c0_g1_i1.p1 TRINITY_DN10669_c0_g1~~TRINITY_DN10669_c0_g1_i1.p1  ORF type:complete len:865 (+),score=164.65 TRINITY_DN10669_c0_g1_i1:70-2595(+)
MATPPLTPLGESLDFNLHPSSGELSTPQLASGALCESDIDPRWLILIESVRKLLVTAAGQSGQVPPSIRRGVVSLLADDADAETDLGESMHWNSQVDPEVKIVVVYGYAGEWGELTSFWPCSFICDDKLWPSLEHYYQAAKFAEPEEKDRIRNLTTCFEAHTDGKLKRDGRTLRPHWDTERELVMKAGLYAKFTQVPRCTQALLKTAQRTIVFADKEDAYWGMGNGTGRNMYGQLLMELRELLRRRITLGAVVLAGALVVVTGEVAEKHLHVRAGTMATSNSATLELQQRRQKAVDKKHNKVMWKKGELLGKGGFGTVHLGLNEVTGELMAVKTVEFGADKRSAKRMQELQREVDLMNKLEHPNIVRLFFGLVEEEGRSKKVHIFMEYVSGGSIAGLIKQFGTLSVRVIGQYLEQILSGLHYLHSTGIVHRDIKGANILLAVDGSCKLADFGTSVLIQQENKKQETFCGTPAWMAPEVVREAGHDKSCDVWSIGCMVMEMMTAKVPWTHLGYQGFGLLHYLAYGTEEPQLPPDLCSDELAASFMSRCLKRNPTDRPTAQDLHADPFVRCWDERGRSPSMMETGVDESRRPSAQPRPPDDVALPRPPAAPQRGSIRPTAPKEPPGQTPGGRLRFQIPAKASSTNQFMKPTASASPSPRLSARMSTCGLFEAAAHAAMVFRIQSHIEQKALEGHRRALSLRYDDSTPNSLSGAQEVALMKARAEVSVQRTTIQRYWRSWSKWVARRRKVKSVGLTTVVATESSAHQSTTFTTASSLGALSEQSARRRVPLRNVTTKRVVPVDVTVTSITPQISTSPTGSLEDEDEDEVFNICVTTKQAPPLVV